MYVCTHCIWFSGAGTGAGQRAEAVEEQRRAAARADAELAAVQRCARGIRYASAANVTWRHSCMA